ncbi:hypothetical protein MMPV_001393 [Pyropia vietnamensis]
MPASLVAPPGWAAATSLPSLQTVRSRLRQQRRRSTPIPRGFFQLSLLVLAAAVTVSVASAAVIVPPLVRQLVEPAGVPPGWTLLLGKFSGEEENPPRDSPGIGTAAGMVWGRDLHLRWSFSDLSTRVNAVHVHSAPPGMNNPDIVVDVFPLTLFSQSGRAGQGNLTVTLTPDGLETANAGNLYMNIHSDSLPNGELRTQLWSVSADQLSKTGNVTSAATAAVVAAGRRNEADDGGGKTAAVVVGIVAGVVGLSAVLFVGVKAVRRRYARQQVEAKATDDSPRAASPAASSGTAAGEPPVKAAWTHPEARGAEWKEEPRRDAWAYGGLPRATAANNDDECSQIVPLSSHAMAQSGSSRTAGRE